MKAPPAEPLTENQRVRLIERSAARGICRQLAAGRSGQVRMVARRPIQGFLLFARIESLAMRLV
jgi:hypothetical protein